jgi:hypothetical protein
MGTGCNAARDLNSIPLAKPLLNAGQGRLERANFVFARV